MSRYVGNIIIWEPKPGYPTFFGEKNNETIEAQYTAANSQLGEYLPEYGSSFYDERFPFLNTFSGLRLSSRSIVPLSGNQSVEISLKYTTPGIDYDDNDDEIEYVNREFDVPIEQHSDYLKNWNCELHAKDSVVSSPAWWLTAKADHVIPSEDAKSYRWVKPGEQPESGWYKLLAVAKPGLESFKAFVPEVHYKKYSSTKSSLQSFASKDGTRQGPPDTFGRSGEWLQSGSSIRREGRWWVLTVTYLNSKTWDNEVYD